MPAVGAIRGEKPDMYVVEHQELFASIRGTGPRRFDGDWMISSCLLGIMGQLAGYTRTGGHLGSRRSTRRRSCLPTPRCPGT